MRTLLLFSRTPWKATPAVLGPCTRVTAMSQHRASQGKPCHALKIHQRRCAMMATGPEPMTQASLELLVAQRTQPGQVACLCQENKPGYTFTSLSWLGNGLAVRVQVPVCSQGSQSQAVHTGTHHNNSSWMHAPRASTYMSSTLEHADIRLRHVMPEERTSQHHSYPFQCHHSLTTANKAAAVAYATYSSSMANQSHACA